MSRLLKPKIIFVFVLAFISCVNCLILQGELNSNDKSWVFIGKFCFVSRDSRFEFEISYPESLQTQNLLLYFDSQWTSVYPKTSKSCTDKENELSSPQILNLTTVSSRVTCDSSVINGVQSINCSDKRIFISSRARYWFIVLSRCGDSKGLKLKYNFLMTNGDGPFVKHFSYDEMGILETSLAFFIIYFVMCIILAIFAKILIDKTLLHTTFKLFLVSVLFQLVGFLFMMSEYAQFSSTGLVTTGMVTASRVFESIGQIIFLLMLILVAKGYTITRNALRTPTVIKITIFFCIYVVAYVIVFIYSEALFDPGIVNYYNTSPGGIAVIVIKLALGWAWFLYSVIFTIKNFPEKRGFYITLVVLFTIWFWIGPALILICGYIVEDYIRQYVSYVIQSIIIFLGHFFFLILTLPIKYNKMFPFHVKTNQIALINNPKGDLPHHDENKGGNTELNDVNLSNLFTVKNKGNKYEVSSDYQFNDTQIK